MKVKLGNQYLLVFSECQQKKLILGQFETFEQIHLHFSAISKLAEKYSFGKLYLEIHHLLFYYMITIWTALVWKIPHRIIGLILQDVFRQA